MELADRRGLALTELPGSTAFALFCADLDSVGDALAAALGVAVERGVSPERAQAGPLFQHAGQAWTVCYWPVCAEAQVAKVAAELGCEALYWQFEDTSGWFGLELFEGPTSRLAYSYGPDYPDELAEYAEMMGGEVPDPARSGTWDVVASAEGTQYWLRGGVLTEAEATSGEALVDRLLRERDAWLPDWAHIPVSAAGCAGLDRVDCAQVPRG